MTDNWLRPEREIALSIAKWGSIGLAIVVTVIVLFWAEENIRGAHDWAVTKKELLAKGEILDPHQLSLPGKPEDDLANVPIYAEICQRPESLSFNEAPAEGQNPRMYKIRANFADYSSKILPPSMNGSLDLVAWQKYYLAIPSAHLSSASAVPAEDVVKVLSSFDDDLKEIQAAVGNPNAYLEPDFSRPDYNVQLPIINCSIPIAKVLRVRSGAYLALGRTEDAKNDYLLTLRLLRPLEKTGSMLWFLFEMANREIGDSILAEGLRGHRWSEVQLREMESELAASDRLKVAKELFRGERADTLFDIDFFQHQKRDAVDTPSYREIWDHYHHRPAGWLDMDRSELSRYFQAQIEGMDLDKGRVREFVPVKTSGLQELWMPLARQAEENAHLFYLKIAEDETRSRLARLACRLELYYLAHKQYPDSLAGLGDLPPHLTEEALTGTPLHYRGKGDDYVLYSSGADGKDHGGVDRKPGQRDDNAHDWVWPRY